MSEIIIEQAERLIERIKQKYPAFEGRTATIEDMISLQAQLEILLPNNIIDLYTKVPIIDAEFGFQEFNPEPDYDGISYIIWGDTESILKESLEFFPGMHVLKEGYIFVASCSHGSGDPIFIKLEDTNTIGVYRVYHDDFSIVKISNSLTEFIKNAKI